MLIGSMRVIIGTLAILVLLLLIQKKCVRKEPPERALHVVDSVLYWKNEANRATASLKKMESEYGIKNQLSLDSVARVYRTKEKHLKEVLSAHLISSVIIPVDSNKTSLSLRIDTSGGYFIREVVQTYINPWYEGSAVIGGSNPHLQINTYDTLTVVWKRVREGSIFNRRHLLQVDVSNSNPYAQITGLKAYRIPEKRHRFAIGVQAGYGFSVGSIPKPYVGFGLQYNLLCF